MAECLLRYGLKDGALISVEDVVSGLKCGCVCPSCGAPLMARKGNIREHHFAHYGHADCNHGSESALHLLAKRILLSQKSIFVPDEVDEDTGGIESFAVVELESREYQSIVPDVVMKNDNRTLCVEILVTHAVDEEKERKIVEAKIPTIEVDLSELVDEYDEALVTEVLLSGRNTEWIYNDILAEKWRKQRIIDEVCDYLPPVPEGYWNDYYDCLKMRKRVSCDDCHDCLHFNNHTSYAILPPLACSYRERNLLKLEIEDCRNIVRKEDCEVLSIEVLIGGEWQKWTGNANSTLGRGKSTEEIGKTVFELWKPEYSGMVVRSLLDGKEMLINGREGEMYKNYNDRIVGKYSNKGYDGKFHYSTKYYVVWGAEKPIWDLAIAFPLKT